MKKYRVLYLPISYYPENTGYSNAFQAFVGAVSANADIHLDIITTTDLQGAEEIDLQTGSIFRFKKRTAPSFLPLKLISNLSDRLRFYKLLRQKISDGNYDLVFIETFEDFFLLRLLPETYYHKIAIRIHATQETEQYFYFPGMVNKIARTVLSRVIRNKVKYIISTNHYHNNFIKEVVLKNNVYQIAQKCFFVLPNTMKASTVSPDGSIASEKNGAGSRSFVTLGRMDKTGILQKGFDDIIDALTLVRDEIKNSRILFIGNGSGKERLVKRAAISGLPFIEFKEGLTNIETLKILREADMVILASRYEGMSMFALEALSTGNALLFSNTGGLPDMVHDNGALFEPQNVEDLAAKILYLQNLSSEELKKMKQVSMDIYEKKFSNKIIADTFLNIVKIISSRN